MPIPPRMPELEKVRVEVNAAHELFEDGPSDLGGMLDFVLPALYRAIGNLYTALDESKRLENFPDGDPPDAGLDPTSRSEVVIDIT